MTVDVGHRRFDGSVCDRFDCCNSRRAYQTIQVMEFRFASRFVSERFGSVPDRYGRNSELNIPDDLC